MGCQSYPAPRCEKADVDPAEMEHFNEMVQLAAGISAQSRAMVRVMRRFLLILSTLLIAVPAVYIGIAFGLAALTPRLALPQGRGIAIYACDNGVHTDLVLPVAAEGIDWRQLPHPDPYAIAAFSHVSFGWGSKDFYINTPTWADVRPMTALKALLWDETVLHVEYRPEPQPGEACGVWVVGSADYQRIAAHVRASLRGWPMQRPVLVAQGYWARDAFLAGEGQYTAIDTCNQWTGQALRAGGAPVAAWTPFSFLVTWNMPMISG
jgi:uncharacterized protein (TIGR02117 family)